MKGNTDKKIRQLFFFGRPLSPLYGFLMTVRSSLYEKGLLQQHRLEVPVISVGNLVLGGTGKTPLVHYIAGFLLRHGRKPAILSRGYKGSAAAAVNVVATPAAILLDAAAAGDEPRLLAEKLPGIPVITGKKRFTTGRFAIDAFGADALILDDGFQHLALQRDLNLVLFSGRQLLSNGRVLPGGELREPISALKRADGFVVTGVATPAGRDIEEFIGRLQRWFPEKPVFTGRYQPAAMLRRLHNQINDTMPLAAAADMRLYGFCGIAGPESFKQTLESSGMNLAGFRVFGDHHAYSAADVLSLCADAEKSGAAALITTEKDLVKVPAGFSLPLPLLALPVQLHFSEDFDRYLADFLTRVRM